MNPLGAKLFKIQHMMESVMPFKEFNHGVYTRDVYRRIQLAAAVHIIKSTPKGVSPEAHATNVQRKLKAMWLSSPMSSGASELSVHVDRHVLFKLQELLAFRLSSIISEIDQKNLTAPSASECVENKTHEICKVQAIYDKLSMNKHKIQATASFIQAIIQLKALAEAQTTVPLGKYVTSVSSMCNRMQLLNFPHNKNISEEIVETQHLTSNDSGFCTIDNMDVNKLPEPVKGVASSFILYIVNSCNTNELLLKSIESIIIHLRDIALHDDGMYLNDTVNQWRGSVYHHAMLSFQPIFCDQSIDVNKSESFQDLCLSVFTEIFEHLCKKNYSVKDDYSLRENQTVLLFQLCHATNLSTQIIDTAFVKIKELLNLVLEKDSSFEEQFAKVSFHHDYGVMSSMQKYLSELESSFCVFRLAKSFLQNLNFTVKTRGGQNSPRGQVQKIMPCSIGDRWRKHYSAEVNNQSASPAKDFTRDSASKVNSWRNLLSDSLENTLFNHSTIAVNVYECMTQLSALDL